MAASLVLAATFAQAEVGAYSTLSTPETVRWFTSFATIRETDEPGAVAEVLFHNVAVNGFYDQGYSEITLDGLTVGVRFIFNADQSGADRIVITPPDGFMAVPDTLTVPEGADGLALIYPAGPMS